MIINGDGGCSLAAYIGGPVAQAGCQSINGNLSMLCVDPNSSR